MMFITRLQNLWWSMVYNATSSIGIPWSRERQGYNVQPSPHHVHLCAAWRPTYLLLLPLQLPSLLLLLSLNYHVPRTSCCLYPRTRHCIYYYCYIYSMDRNCFGIMLFCAIKLLIMLNLKQWYICFVNELLIFCYTCISCRKRLI